jgi:hypothetical protein
MLKNNEIDNVPKLLEEDSDLVKYEDFAKHFEVK